MNIKISIPEALNDIPLYQYQDFVKIKEPTEKDILNIFYDIQDVNSIKKKDAEYLIKQVSEVLNEKPVFQPKIQIGSKWFGFIPNLDDISYGENIDVTNYINDKETLHKAMAVLYRPITKEQNGKYLIEPYEGSNKYAEVMRKYAPLSAVLGALVFFYNLTNDLLKAIPAFIEREKHHLSVKNGEVINQYTNSLRATLEDLTKSLSYHYTNA